MKLKRLEDQVIVITGASSGIGLVTARMAAGELKETGDYDGHVAATSVYTKARLHPRIAAGSLAFLATALGYALLRRTSTGHTTSDTTSDTRNQASSGAAGQNREQ